MQEQNVFVADGYVPENPPRLTLCYDDKSTLEGQLKAAILRPSAQRSISVVACGPGGTGKTCALRGLRHDPQIKDTFCHGMVYVLLGKDATIATVIQQISFIVKRTGNEQLSHEIMLAEELLQATELARKWFRNRSCLFVVDDLCVNKEIDVNVLYTLADIMSSGSLLVYSTRDETVSKEATELIRFVPHDPLGDVSRSILAGHAGLKELVVSEEKNKEGLQGILEMCDGLPLALGAAGSVIRELRPMVTGPEQRALSLYYNDLKLSRRNIASERVSRYGMVRDVLATSLNVLERRWNEVGGSAFKISINEMFRCLCVLERKQTVPIAMLRRLWHICGNDPVDVERVMMAMKSVGLVEVLYQCDKADGIRQAPELRVHGTILDVLVYSANENGGVQAYIKRLMDSYWSSMQDRSGNASDMSNKRLITGLSNERTVLRCLNCWTSRRSKAGLEQTCECPKMSNSKRIGRKWWELEDDGYILNDVCRLLKEIGCVEELIWLLFTPQWIVRRLRSNGGAGVEKDIAIGMKALDGLTVDRKEEKKKSLILIEHAARMSQFAVTSNFREAYFQLYGRLLPFGEQLEVMKTFLEDLEHVAERPWAKAGIGFLRSSSNYALDHFKVSCVPKGMVTAANEVKVFGWKDNALDAHFEVSVYDERNGSMNSKQLDDAVLHCEYASMSGDGKLIAAVEPGGRILMLNVEDGDYVEVLRDAKSFSPKALALTDDGSIVACLSELGEVRVWDVKKGRKSLQILSKERSTATYESSYGLATKKMRVHDPDFSVTCMAISSASNTMVTGMKDGTVRMWNLEHLSPICDPQSGHDEAVKYISISPNGKWIASWSRSGEMITTEVDDDDVGIINFLKADEFPNVSCIALSNDAKTVITGLESGAIVVWNYDSNGLEFWESTILHHGSVRITHVSVSADGSRGYSVAKDGTVRTWDLSCRSSELNVVSEDEDESDITCVAADERWVVAGLRNGKVRLWDGERGIEIPVALTRHDGPVHCVAFSQDGRYLASGSTDGSLRIWDTAHRTSNCSNFTGHTGYVSCAAFSLDGKRVAAGYSDGNVWVGYAENPSGAAVVLSRHKRMVNSLALSRDGSRVVTGSGDQTTIVWDVGGGRIVETLDGDGNPVTSVAINSQGTRVVFATGNSIVMWNELSFSNPTCTHRFCENRYHVGKVISLAMSCDDSHVLVTGSITKTRSQEFWPTNNVMSTGLVLIADAMSSGSSSSVLMELKDAGWDAVVQADANFCRHEAGRPLLQGSFAIDEARLVLATPDCGTIQRCKFGFWTMSRNDVQFCQVLR